MPAEITKILLWLVLLDEVCVISSSYLYWGILYLKSPNQCFMKLIGTRIKDMIAQDEINN